MSRRVRVTTIVGTLSSMVGALLFAVLFADRAAADPTCTIYWTGAASELWQSGANWSATDGGPAAQRVPGPSDFACMSTSPVEQSVVASARHRAIAGLDFSATDTVTPSLQILGGVLNVKTYASTINDVTLDGGASLTGGAAVTLTGNSYASSGPVAFAGRGVKTVAAGATLSVLTPITVGLQTVGHAQLVVDGSLVLDADLTASAAPKGTPNSIVNNGQLTLGPDVSVIAGGTGAVAPTFTNNGTVSTTGGTATISVPFTNAGTVNGTAPLAVQAGNVAGTPDTGAWSVSPEVIVSADRSVASGSFDNLEIAGATTSFGDGVPVGQLTLDATGTVAGSPTVAMATLDGTLQGPGTMTLTGPGSQACGLALVGAYQLDNNGELSYSTACAPITLAGGSALTNGGTFEVSGGTGSISDDLDPASALVNTASGTLTVDLDDAAHTFTIATPFTNDGTLTVTRGRVAPTEGVSNLSGDGTLTGGTWSVASGKIVLPTAIHTNAASIEVNPGGTFSPLLNHLGANEGSLKLAANLSDVAALTNSGSVAVVDEAELDVGDYTQVAGTTHLGQQSVLATQSGTAAFDGGMLTGSGFVAARVTSSATVVPGTNGTGELGFASYAQTSSGTLQVVPGDTDIYAYPPSFGAQDGSPLMTVAGTLVIVAPDPIPPIGTSATVVGTTDLQGTFDTVLGQSVPSASAYWAVAYASTGVTLTLTANPAISIADVSAPEGDSGTSPMTFTATLSAPSQVPVTVDFRTKNGTAKAGSDYLATSGTATFAPGETSAPITVLIKGDTMEEPNETFTLRLSNPTNAALAVTSATGTILNDEPT